MAEGSEASWRADPERGPAAVVHVSSSAGRLPQRGDASCAAADVAETVAFLASSRAKWLT